MAIGTPVLLLFNGSVVNGAAQTITASSPAGALIVVNAIAFGSGQATSITDSKGNVYTKASDTGNGGSGGSSMWFSSSAAALTSGVDTITLNYTGVQIGFAAGSVTAANGGNDSVTNLTLVTTGVSASFPATGTLGASSEIIFVGGNNQHNWGGLAITDGAGAFLSLENSSGDMLLYQILSSNASQTVNLSWTTSGAIQVSMAGFKATGSGGGGTDDIAPRSGAAVAITLMRDKLSGLFKPRRRLILPGEPGFAF